MPLSCWEALRGCRRIYLVIAVIGFLLLANMTQEWNAFRGYPWVDVTRKTELLSERINRLGGPPAHANVEAADQKGIRRVERLVICTQVR